MFTKIKNEKTYLITKKKQSEFACWVIKKITLNTFPVRASQKCPAKSRVGFGECEHHADRTCLIRSWSPIWCPAEVLTWLGTIIRKQNLTKKVIFFVISQLLQIPMYFSVVLNFTKPYLKKNRSSYLLYYVFLVLW